MNILRYWKEVKELRKLKLQLQVDLLGKLYTFIEEINTASKSGISTEEAMNIIKKLQNVDEKDIAKELAANLNLS